MFSDFLKKHITSQASYVEFGHRKIGGKGWVQGKFMLTISEQEIKNNAPKILENKIKKYIMKIHQKKKQKKLIQEKSIFLKKYGFQLPK